MAALDPRRWTIRSRITVLATVAVAIILLLSGVVLVGAQRRQQQADLDRTLSLRADDVERLIAASVGPPDLAGIAGRDQLAQLVTIDGTVLSSGADLGDQVVIPPPAGTQATRTITDLPIEDDAYRVLSRRVRTPTETVVLHVGENVDDVNDSVGNLTRSLALTVPVATGVLGFLVWWLVGRTLQPVEAIRREVAAIGDGGLDRRVPKPDTGDEIAELAETMNGMLDRLEASDERQRRFVADASHELRSPLTRIRTEVEVASRSTTDRNADDVFASVLEETATLQRLVGDLLFLARSDDPRAANAREPVDLDDIVLREARRLRGEGHTVDLTGLSAAQVLGDADQLTRMIRNIVDNAARHAEDRVTITLAEVGEQAQLGVQDDGSGVSAADRERVFERFTRLDDARARDAGGTGLGLAIVREIVDGHGGRVEVVSPEGEGALFVVWLPLVNGPAGAWERDVE